MRVGFAIPLGLFSIYVLIKLGGFLTGDNILDLIIVSGLLYGSIISTVFVGLSYLKTRKRKQIAN